MTLALDTSALMSVVLGEDDAEAMAAVMLDHRGDLVVSAATRVESGIVAEARRGPAGGVDLDELLDAVAAEVVALDTEQARLAVAAWRRFGRGRHPAALNLGDCFAYALATSLQAALLFKGRDFAQTDVRSAT